MRPFLSIAALASLAAVALPTGGPAAAQSPACPGRDQVPTAETLDAARSATLCLVNRERASRGLGNLRSVGALTSVATAYAKRMVKEDFFDHTAPNGSTFTMRIMRTDYLDRGVRAWSLGENLAWGTGQLSTPQAIVASWMQSPGHRRNILTASFDELGLGVSLGAPRSGVADGRAATYVNEFGGRRR